MKKVVLSAVILSLVATSAMANTNCWVKEPVSHKKVYKPKTTAPAWKPYTKVRIKIKSVAAIVSDERWINTCTTVTPVDEYMTVIIWNSVPAVSSAKFEPHTNNSYSSTKDTIPYVPTIEYGSDGGIQVNKPTDKPVEPPIVNPPVINPPVVNPPTVEPPVVEPPVLPPVGPPVGPPVIPPNDPPIIPPVTPITPVPEPQTWAMLILGFFGIGTIIRRRNNFGKAAKDS